MSSQNNNPANHAPEVRIDAHNCVNCSADSSSMDILECPDQGVIMVCTKCGHRYPEAVEVLSRHDLRKEQLNDEYGCNSS